MSHLLEHLVFKGTRTANGPGDRPGPGEPRGIPGCLYLPGTHQLPGPGPGRPPPSGPGGPGGPGPGSPPAGRGPGTGEGGGSGRDRHGRRIRPDDLVFDLHGARLWGGHPYGNTILGTRETVGDTSGTALSGTSTGPLHGSEPGGGGGGSGTITTTCVAQVKEPSSGTSRRGSSPATLPELPAASVGDEWVDRDSAQTHLVFGRAMPGHSDPRRFPLALLSSALGGGMSSRLFQRVREELALVYSVFTFQSFYTHGRRLRGLPRNPAVDSGKGGGGRPGGVGKCGPERDDGGRVGPDQTAGQGADHALPGVHGVTPLSVGHPSPCTGSPSPPWTSCWERSTASLGRRSRRWPGVLLSRTDSTSFGSGPGG